MDPLVNPILERMRAHCTVRHFETEELEDSTVRLAVGCAQMAATSSNVQADALLRVTDSAERARLAELAGGQQQVERAGGFFVICADQRRHRLLAEACGRQRQVNLETFLLGVIDASLFAQNLVLAFESMGLGTCFIGGLRNRLAAADELLKLPTDVLPLFGLCVGSARESDSLAAPKLRPRLGVDAAYFEDRFPPDATMLARRVTSIIARGERRKTSAMRSSKSSATTARWRATTNSGGSPVTPGAAV